VTHYSLTTSISANIQIGLLYVVTFVFDSFYSNYDVITIHIGVCSRMCVYLYLSLNTYMYMIVYIKNADVVVKNNKYYAFVTSL